MTLFFVLSGFVIHYNYAGLVTGGRLRGIGAFLWARFARLYPLFLRGDARLPRAGEPAARRLLDRTCRRRSTRFSGALPYFLFVDTKLDLPR